MVASEGLEITWRSSALRSSINNRRKLGFSICLVPECMHGDGAKANDGRCSCGHTSLCTCIEKLLLLHKVFVPVSQSKKVIPHCDLGGVHGTLGPQANPGRGDL